MPGLTITLGESRWHTRRTQNSRLRTTRAPTRHGLGTRTPKGTGGTPRDCLRDLDSQTGGPVRAPVVGAPTPNSWTNREPQTPGNINRSEASWRSSSWHQDPALANCLQTPALDISGQTTSKTVIQHHPSKKKKK